jgi:hypothetical protein
MKKASWKIAPEKVAMKKAAPKKAALKKVAVKKVCLKAAPKKVVTMKKACLKAAPKKVAMTTRASLTLKVAPEKKVAMKKAAPEKGGDAEAPKVAVAEAEVRPQLLTKKLLEPRRWARGKLGLPRVADLGNTTGDDDGYSMKATPPSSPTSSCEPPSTED